MSRPKRWFKNVSAALDAIDTITDTVGDLEAALDNLNSLKEEYEEWQENLPENLECSPIGEKLDAIAEFEFEDAAANITASLEEAQTLLEEADAADLPLGFGRD